MGAGDDQVDGRLVEVLDEGPVRTLSLARPDKRNALSDALRHALAEQVDALATDESCRVVVLRGQGPSFSAGADLLDPASRFDGEWARRRLAGGAWQRLLDAFESLPQATVAVVHGHVIGGGVLLALACDLRVGAGTTRWRIPELAIGLPLTWGGIPRLVREVGTARARDLVMTGREVDADEAHRIGLQHRLVPAAELEGAAADEVERLAAMPAGAMQATKAAFAAIGRHTGGRELFWADPDLLHFAMSADETAAHARRHVRDAGLGGEGGGDDQAGRSPSA
jgi:enoyl-CoA hydratase/carnithine racemase